VLSCSRIAVIGEVTARRRREKFAGHHAENYTLVGMVEAIAARLSRHRDGGSKR
jgi:hypothetical protein